MYPPDFLAALPELRAHAREQVRSEKEKHTQLWDLEQRLARDAEDTARVEEIQRDQQRLDEALDPLIPWIDSPAFESYAAGLWIEQGNRDLAKIVEQMPRLAATFKQLREKQVAFVLVLPQQKTGRTVDTDSSQPALLEALAREIRTYPGRVDCPATWESFARLVAEHLKSGTFGGSDLAGSDFTALRADLGGELSKNPPGWDLGVGVARAIIWHFLRPKTDDELRYPAVFERLADAIEAEAAKLEATTAPDDPDTLLSAVKLADRLGISKEDAKAHGALRKRLESWRKANLDGGWIETKDRKPREPRYLYPLGKVWPLIEDLKPSG